MILYNLMLHTKRGARFAQKHSGSQKLQKARTLAIFGECAFSFVSMLFIFGWMLLIMPGGLAYLSVFAVFAGLFILSKTLGNHKHTLYLESCAVLGLDSRERPLEKIKDLGSVDEDELYPGKKKAMTPESHVFDIDEDVIEQWQKEMKD